MVEKRKIDQKKLVEDLSALGLNQFLSAVMKANKNHQADLSHFIADAVALDIQGHMLSRGIVPTCPKCGSKESTKDGKRGEIQRYRCKDCHTRYTLFSGTLLDKTYYSWDVWVHVIRDLMDKKSLYETKTNLAKEVGCADIDLMTIWLIRMKVMYAISKIPSPTLRGVIQIDDTYLREDQKGVRVLVNPLPTDILPRREPRKRKTPSVLGIRGNEFATITTAIDGSGQCVCRVLGCGSLPDGIVYDFLKDHTDDISFLCSDCDDTYIRVARAMGVAHYTRPSNYMTVATRGGYETPSSVDKELGKRQWEEDLPILERLWKEGLIDDIRNRGRLTFTRFRALVRENNLNLAKVNHLHRDLKEWLEYKTTGVSTKLLPYYIAWFEYAHNKGLTPDLTQSNLQDAEDVLIDAIETRANLTKAMLEEIRKKPLQLPQASNRYIRLLEENTAKIRLELDDDTFYFGDEDSVSTFKAQNILWALPNAKIRELAKRLQIRGYRGMSRSELIEELKGHEDLTDHLYIVAVNGNGGHSDGAAEARTRILRQCLPSMFPSEKFITPQEATAEGKRVVFVDVETTGLDVGYDELLQVAVVSLDGEVLYESLIRPRYREKWDPAAKVHHIEPSMVVDAPRAKTVKPDIEAALTKGDVICGWNLSFDLKMLYSNGIDLPGGARYCDLMPAFAQAWKEHGNTPGYRRVAREKLTRAAEYLGIEYNAHDALADAAVLTPIWAWVLDATSSQSS